MYSFIPFCQFENVFPSYFCIEIEQNFHMIFREFIEHTVEFYIETVFHIITFILCWSMNVQNNDMTAATS
jgi:hypothetical protein